RGEPFFRDLEREILADLLVADPAIIASGGGWAVQPGNLDSVAGKALTLYMCVSPEVAASRLGLATDRPLLSGAVLPRLRELLAVREKWYRLADLEIEAAAAPDLVAAAVATA